MYPVKTLFFNVYPGGKVRASTWSKADSVKVRDLTLNYVKIELLREG